MKIKEFCQIERGSSPRPIVQHLTDSLGLPWLKISDLNSNKTVIYTKEFINHKSKIYTKVVHKGQLMLTNSGTPGIPFFIGKTMGVHDGFIIIKNNQKTFLNDYLYYWFIKNNKFILTKANGTIFQNLKKSIIEDLEINEIKVSIQQHIIDIIEPFEKLAAIYEKLIKLINNLFSLITKIYSLQTKEKLLSYFNFIKGTEISNSKRTKNIENKLVKYIRVGDLTFNSERQSLYCTKDNNFLCDFKDILLATDGDPGRIMTGLNGVFSSSIRKVIPKTTNHHSSIALLNLLNPINKEIFNAYTTGTTIKHGGNNAIKNLKYFKYEQDIKILVKSLYENLTTLQNNLTKIIIIKNLLINKLIK